jgi:hypothetical protein
MPDVEIGAFTPERARRVWQATLAVERGIDAPTTDLKQFVQAPIYFVNKHTSTIPPYGIIQKIATEEIGDQNYIHVTRPFIYTGSVIGPFLINGPREVEPEDLGVAQNGPIYRAYMDSTAYATGTRIGPKVDSFLAGKGCLYTFIGTDDIDTDIAKLIACETPLLAITSGAISGGSSGNAVAKVPTSGDWTAGSITYLVWNPSVTTIASGRLVMIFPVDAKWAAIEIC